MAKRDFLRDRGLAPESEQASPYSQAFGVDFATGQIIPAEQEQQTQQSLDLPNDYAARLIALQTASVLLAHGSVAQCVEAAHMFHAFLTATEAKSQPQFEKLHTDE